MGSLIKVFLLCCATLEIYGTDQKPLVTTKYGQLLGKTVGVKGTDRSVHAFMGVPFAKPPTGPLRYADPQPPEPWSSVREATAPPSMCIQDRAIIENMAKMIKANFVLPPVSEDCLYLNVFTPADREENAKLPVMVFIHGGGLVLGCASLYDGSALCAYEDVVMVSMQYRLGLLGFLSTSDKEAQGNLGFMDQVAALQWVQDNIKAFGGDPQSVTIFGESAGGLSVSAHILSPLSKNLFHRAIAESGVAVFPNLMVHKTEDMHSVLDLISSKSGCDLPLKLNCLKNKTEDEILAIIVSMGFIILPACVDGMFLPKPAEEILAAKESNPVPFMIGVNNHEFSWVIPMSLNISGFMNGMNKRDIQSLLQSSPLLRIDSNAIPAIMEEYFGDTSDPIEVRDNFLELGGDMLFLIPALKTANYHRDSGLPVYFYEFQHRPSLYGDSKGDFVKADHGDEIYFVFGGPFLSGDVTFQGDGTDEEEALSKKIMKYWANFARNGNPNGSGLTEWLKYDENEHYLELNLTQKSSQRLKEGRFKFWNTHPEKRNVMEKSEERAEL
ncbi:fatty acyl-CoA hydrolase precursor, medium chain isoform X1 [Xenopus tropicalis]|uniref:Carboxylic ester hydrolase n=2 Tax=Xenopus tropicalis TaxID=8364 RepID=A0A8J0QNE1_XENTR|nr:fatty acyl-CoA hydrolase precursor, medium chain isoform X1 [Xenopus tropicalis]